jgi:hypothetical protein
MWVSIGNTGSATTAPVMNVTTVNTNQAAALMTATASATTMKKKQKKNDQIYTKTTQAIR